MPEAVIVAAARTPIGRAFKGSLAEFRPDDLAVLAVEAALDQVPGLDRELLEDLYLGCAEPSGEAGANMARVVAVLLGLDRLPGATVNRFCASSVQTTRMAAHAIRAGEGDAFVSAGVESVSRYERFAGAGQVDPAFRNPAFDAAQARTAADAARPAGGRPWHDPREDGGLPDVYLAMGQTAENVAALHDVSRRRQDEWAVVSQHRAEAAIAAGFFAREITPVRLADGSLAERDDAPRAGVTLDRLAELPAAFREGGTVTAGNCCTLSDGAAALVVVSDRFAADHGLRPLARVVSTGVSALSPEIMGLGPVEATRRALRRAGLGIGDIDRYELNEAFAAQVLPVADQLGMDLERLNTRGGAIALGHPFGMTGARITTTLLNVMAQDDVQFGLETLCVGGGQGMAIVYERLS